ncbi:MAG: YCF48-related protein, partial [Micromonosporaceae bacterium]
LRTTDGGRTWQPQDSGTTDALGGVWFHDPLTGTAVGGRSSTPARATVLHTVDGGATWTAREVDATTALNAVAFADGAAGVAVGNGGQVIVTDDGGATWSLRSGGTTQPLAAVAAADLHHATAVGAGGTIVRTTDGGHTWVSQDSGVTAALHGVAFTDPLTGTVVGDAGTILRTVDGGRTWLPQQPPEGTPALRAVAFADADTGTAVGDDGVVLRTTDGGRTWVRQTSGVDVTLRAVTMLDAATAVAVGDVGTILTTHDGGATWVFRNSGRTAQLWGVAFFDPDHGVAVGNSGQILRTTDGGRTWTLVPSGTTAFLRAAAVADHAHGYVVGDGVVLRTTDGGQTWTPEQPGTTTGLHGVAVADVHTGLAVGQGGTIIGRVGTGPAAGLTPVTVRLDATVVGDVSPARTVTVRNTGNAPLTVGRLAVSGDHADDFRLGDDTCSGRTVAVAATCTVAVTLRPTAAGERTATLQVPSDAPTGSGTVELDGLGLAPDPLLDARPAEAAFALDQGQRGRQVVTVRNLGGRPLAWEVAGGSGCDLPDWLVAVPTGGELPPAGEQRVDLLVDATGLPAGEHSATVCLAGDDPVHPRTQVPVLLTVTEATPDSGWSTFGDGVTAGTGVEAVATLGGDLYAAGGFLIVDGVRANNIARWDGAAWSPLSGGTNGPVRALAASGTDLYVGGFFTRAGGVPAAHVARWDGTAWSPLGSGLDGNVHDLVVSGDVVYASGSFPGGVARFDGTDWTVVGEGIDAANVPAIAVSGDEIYAGVAFQGVWRWDGQRWSSLGGPAGTVNTLTVVGDTLYAGGSFTSAGGAPASFVARWDGTAWHPLGSGTDLHVFATAARGDGLVAGGFFSRAGDEPANTVAVWDGDTWSGLGSGIGSGPESGEGVNALAVSGNQVLVGGNFLTAGGRPANRLAAWRDPTLVGVGVDVVSGAGTVELRDPFTVTGVSLRVEPGAGAGHVNAYRYDDAPRDPAGVVGEVSGYRWVLQQSGLATPFLAELRFTLADLPDHGLADPDRVSVYLRPTPGHGRFEPLPTAYDPATGVITARTTGVGELVFGAAPASGRPSGEVRGTVTGVDCDGTRRPLGGAVVRIEGRTGDAAVTLRTDFEGGYRWWFTPRDNALTLVVAKDGYVPHARKAWVTPGQVVVEDVTLTAVCPPR